MIDNLQDMLPFIDGSDYDTWMRTGMAMYHEGHSLGEFIDWSRTQPGFKSESDCEYHWKSFASGNGCSAGTIVHLAKQGGYSPMEKMNKLQTNSLYAGADSAALARYLNALFKADDIVCIESSHAGYNDKKGKWEPHGGDYLKVSDILKALEKNSPEKILKAKREPGAWIRINPMTGISNGSGKGSESNVTRFDHVLIEADHMDIEEQISAYKRHRLPIAMLVHSGARSAHAIVRIQATDKKQFDERVNYLYDYLKQNDFDLDPANKNGSRYTRLPGVHRGDVMQRLLPIPTGIFRNWLEWESWTKSKSGLMTLFKPLSEIIERPAEWLIDGWVPKEQITIFGGDGGTGKTASWCNVVAAISSGSASIFEQRDIDRKPMTVLVCSAEDSLETIIKPRLRAAGADMSNIYGMDMAKDSDGLLKDFKFGKDELNQVIRQLRPALVVFDPIEGFIPRDVQMGARNQMRDCTAPFISLGSECGSTFLLIAHSNKRSQASGRNRLADSSDLWDVSRSVVLFGPDGDGGFYASHEKCNYGRMQKSVLFAVDGNGRAIFVGRSTKKDRDFIEGVQRSGGKLDDAIAFIAESLEAAGGRMKTHELDEKAKSNGFSGTLRRAKDTMKDMGHIKYDKVGNEWYTALVLSAS